MFYHLLHAIALRMAALPLGHIGEIAILVVFDDDLRRVVHGSQRYS